MENNTYIVSARKYRPQTFDTIVGQEHVTNTLKNAILTNQIAQAYLFFGPRGVGKTTCARVFAKTINCLNLKPDGEACNECTSCKSFNSNTSFNIYELDAASNNSVEDIRQLIDQVRYPPQIGKYKVYIIDEVHMLSTAAFNAFLKTLEEPPSYAKFILATTEKNKVLPTILSRCQVFNFNRIKTEDIAKYLERIAAKENHQYEHEALRIIAQKADGGLRDACSIYDQMAAFTQGNITTQAVIENLHVLDYDFYFQMTDACLNQDYTKIIILLDKVFNKGFDPQNVLVGMIDHLRYLLLAKDPQTVTILDVSDTAKSAILDQSKKCSEKFLLNALSILNKADINFRSSRHQKLHLEIHFLQLANLQQNINELEKKNISEERVTSTAPVNNPSLENLHKNTKVIKVSDKPILNEVTVKTTASIKEITTILSSTISSNKKENIPIQTESTNTIIKETNPNINSDNGNTDSDNILIAENQPHYSSSLKNQSKLSTPPLQSEPTLSSTQQEKKSNTPSSSATIQQGNYNNPPEPTNPSTPKSSDSSIHTSITERRYQALLKQNPLLEELKIKLNLEFK